MNYKDYSADDFIKDEFFQQWVFSPDIERDLYWENFLKEHPSQQSVLQEARQFLLFFDFKDNEIFESRISQLKTRIHQAIDQPDLSVNKQGTGPSSQQLYPKKKRDLLPYKIAASLGCLFLIAYALFFNTNHSFNSILASADQEQVTRKGHRTLITLEDGTKIWLNADSRLKYPESFTGMKTRDVYLEGEGYFDVTEDPDKPFIVHTSELRIKVLGTSFNVKSYDKDKIIQTTLIKGKVSIEPTGEQSGLVTLLPNQQAVFEKKSKKIVLGNQVETENFTAWKEGRLIFDDQPLSVVIAELERWYNVTIQVEDKTSLDCHFSAKVNNKSLLEVLELFKASETIDYRIDGNKVFISGKLCEE